MDAFTNMPALQAAALYIGLTTLLMMGLKMFVGASRGKLKVVPGDTSNPDFARKQRVQQNAVEDVPPLLIGILVLALLGVPAWLVHTAGILLFLSRLAHAVGLANSSGFSAGRMLGTIGTLLVYLTCGFGLIIHVFV